jgi:hypothetical protein
MSGMRSECDGGGDDDCGTIVDVDALPDELLLYIFALLDTKALMTAIPGVCTKWRALCGDTPRVHVDLSFAPRSLLTSPPDRRRTSSARRLSSLEEALKRFKHVETVWAPCGCDGIACSIATSCPRLSAVDLANHVATPGMIIDELTDMGAVALAVNCPRLRLVDLRHGPLTDLTLKAFCGLCPKLTSLAVGGSVHRRSRGVLTGICVQGFVEHFGQQITSLHLEFCENFGDDVVVAIANHCRRLTTFGLPESRITDAGVIDLAQHCPLLTTVIISGCVQLTDASFVALAEYCSQLTVIDAFRCNLLTDNSLVALGRCCPRLANVEFPECVLLTDAGVIALAEGCPLLTDVGLNSCTLLTDAGVTALAKHCSRLKMLHLHGCDQLTDASVDALAEHCKHLVLVNLARCPLVTTSPWLRCMDELIKAQELRREFPQIAQITFM